MQPTMSSSKMVDSDILSDREIEQDGFDRLSRAILEACETVKAIASQRRLMEENRQLKRKQEEELFLSESTDRKKKRQEEDDDDEDKDEDEALDSTVEDIEEVRRRRILALSHTGETSEVQNDKEDNDSGTVILRSN